MDGSRFDAWTRRRVGLAAGGLTVGLLGLTGLAETEAKKKHKKKCKKLGIGCNTTGKKQRCCADLLCEPSTTVGGNRCCLDDGKACSNTNDCCSGFCLDSRCQPNLCKTLGQACSANPQCCSGNCSGFQCAVPVI